MGDWRGRGVAGGPGHLPPAPEAEPVPSHLDLGYRSYYEREAKHRSAGRGPVSLTGAIPPQLWRLPRLRHLDLQGQLLAGTLPSDMGSLVSLEYMDLGNNLAIAPWHLGIQGVRLGLIPIPRYTNQVKSEVLLVGPRPITPESAGFRVGRQDNRCFKGNGNPSSEPGPV